MNRHYLITIVLTGVGFFLGWVCRPQGQAATGTDHHGQPHATRQPGATNNVSKSEANPATELLERASEGANNMSQEQVTESIRMILREKDPLKRTAAFHTMLASADIGGLGKISQALDACYKDGLPTQLFGEEAGRREGRLMGVAGMTSLPGEPNGMPNYLMKHRMRGWASGNPAEAKAWLATLEEGRTKETLRSEWEMGLSSADAEKLLEIFPELPPEQQERHVGNVVEAALLEKGLEGMADWYKKAEAALPEGATNRTFRRVIDSFTQDSSSWTDAVHFLKQVSSPDQALFAEGLMQTVWRGARYDAKQSLQLLEEYLPQNTFLQEAKGEYIRQCLENASTNTVSTIGEWLNIHKDAAIYNDVALALTHHVKEIDPAGARSWAESITDPALRETLLSELPSSP